MSELKRRYYFVSMGNAGLLTNRMEKLTLLAWIQAQDWNMMCFMKTRLLGVNTGDSVSVDSSIHKAKFRMLSWWLFIFPLPTRPRCVTSYRALKPSYKHNSPVHSLLFQGAFSQYVTCYTREERTRDLMYANVKNANSSPHLQSAGLTIISYTSAQHVCLRLRDSLPPQGQ